MECCMKDIRAIISFMIIFSCYITSSADNISQIAKLKIDTLNSLIVQAENSQIDVLHERTTIRTAEIFLKFADWDELHQTENTTSFAQVSRYSKNASEMAAILPNFERNDVVVMLTEAISKLKKKLNSDIVCKPAHYLS